MRFAPDIETHTKKQNEKMMRAMKLGCNEESNALAILACAWRFVMHPEERKALYHKLQQTRLLPNRRVQLSDELNSRTVSQAHYL